MSQHVITYTTSGGRVYDLSGPPRSPALLAWGASLGQWEFEARSDTSHELVRQPAECEASIVAPRAVMNDLLEDMYQDATVGGGELDADGWSRICSARVGAYDRTGGGRGIASVTLRSADPLWRRVTAYDLVPNSGDTTTTTGLDYPTDVPYDYAGTSVSYVFPSESTATPFLVRAIFFGPCSDPYVVVTSTSGSTTTSNRYGVDATATAGERIVVDPLGAGTIGASVYKVGLFGERTNLFDRRLRGIEGSGTYAFQQLPAGAISASWPQNFGVTLDVIEERGSLPWS